MKRLYLLLGLLCALSEATQYALPEEGKIIGYIGAERLAWSELTNFSLEKRIPEIAIKRINREAADSDFVVLPTQMILPDTARQGLVINVAERRLYDFQEPGFVHVYAVGVGKEDWNTPEGEFKISQKRKNPTWYVPPAVIRAERLKGNELPKTMPPGPENPLGDYAMRLSGSSYLLHGTNAGDSIGYRSTSGCISLHNEDIAQIYQRNKVGTPVTIINQPIKTTYESGKWWLEVHREEKMDSNGSQSTIHDDMMCMEKQLMHLPLDAEQRQAARSIIIENTGIPHCVE